MTSLLWPLILAFAILGGIPLLLLGHRKMKTIFGVLSFGQFVVDLAVLPFLPLGRVMYAWADGQLPMLAFNFQGTSKVFLLLNALALLGAGHFLPAAAFTGSGVILLLAITAALNGLALAGNIFTSLIFAELAMMLFYLFYALKWPRSPGSTAPTARAVLLPNFLPSSLLLWPGVILVAEKALQAQVLAEPDIVAALIEQGQGSAAMLLGLGMMFGGGLWLRLGIFPFHRKYFALMLERPMGINLFFLLYLGILTLQTWPQFMAAFLKTSAYGPGLEIVLFFVFAYQMLQACARQALRERGLYYLSGQLSFILLMAVGSLAEKGQLFLLVNTFLVGLGFGLVGTKIRFLEQNNVAAAAKTSLKFLPRFFIILALAAAFFPLAPGIFGPSAIFHGDISRHPWMAAAAVLNFALAAACWLQNLQIVLDLSKAEAAPSETTPVLTPPTVHLDFMPFEKALAIGVVILILANGLFPQWPFGLP